MADKQQAATSGAGPGDKQRTPPGEMLNAELQAEDRRRTQPQDREAEEELSGSPT